jgi:transcriptional regulator with XRE-family HTH domain
MEQTSPRNAIGVMVRRVRNQRGWTQEVLAAKCEVAGCAISRGTLAKIEAQIRTATDIETFVLASVLKVGIDSLYPKGFSGHLRRTGWSRATTGG